ncbi:MAG TPA: hypothetical protein DEA08_01875 [Planctomycetes bacterium]|nr:hypothetical protein [Planctomycetota bacterium]
MGEGAEHESAQPASRWRRALAVIGPGALVAATGVGAGDLATAAFTVDVRGRPYRAYLWGLSLVPLAGLLLEFKAIQKLYAVIGAFFLPLLALTLLALNRERHVGQAKNGPLAIAALLAPLGFFAFVAWRKLA